jgi:chemotaxis protein methyltransferase CheR
VALNPEEFGYVQTLLRQQSAMVLEAGKGYLAEARLTSLARREGYDSVDELLSSLRAGRGRSLQRKVVESMTINETSFFRDIQPFEALRQAILPELIRQRPVERRLRVWSAASSTGQEAYSLAMLWQEHFAAVQPGWSFSVLGTDLCKSIVEQAQQGRFNQVEINRGLPAKLLVKYFTKDGETWRIKEEVRRQVEFRTLNLVKPWPAQPPFDIIFLRNVLIYFDVPTKKDILANVRKVLRPDGYLFLGGAETTMNLDDSFERVAFDRAGAYRLRK